MERTTVMLPPKLKLRAKRKAKAMGISFGELVRESLAAGLLAGNGGKKRDPFFGDCAVWQGKTPSDLSLNHDEYLYGDMARKTRRRRDIGELLQDQELIEGALRRAVNEALKMHKRMGNPIAEWRNGKVVWVPPEKIVIEEPDEPKKAKGRRSSRRATHR